MKRRHHYRRQATGPADLDMTTFLNLMVVLVPFLLITAVFSRITIVELTLPSSDGAAASAPSFRVEVIVREAGLELTNGTVPIAAIPKKEGEYDLDRLGELIVSLKRQHPNKESASVLVEPQIEYDHLIRVMDVVRSAPLGVVGEKTAESPDPASDVQLASAQAPSPQRIALFPDISIGDAP